MCGAQIVRDDEPDGWLCLQFSRSLLWPISQVGVYYTLPICLCKNPNQYP